MENQTSPINNLQAEGQPQENISAQTQQQSDSATTSKKELIDQKKNNFYKLVNRVKFIFFALLILTLTGIIARSVYIKAKPNFHTTNNTVNNNVVPVTVTPTDQPITTELKKYANDKFRFSFNYTQDDILSSSEASTDDYFVRIVGQDARPQENIDILNIINGYIYKINPLIITTRSLNDIVEIKKESFKTICPPTVTISNNLGVNIDGLEGLGFTLTNCNGDAFIKFVEANGYFYEISEIYKGDIGYKQNYKKITGDITSSLKINRDAAPEPSPYLIFGDKVLGFLFAYPRELDTKCCFVAAPPDKYVNSHIVISEGDNSNSIGFYTVKAKSASLEDYVEMQKSILSDDYKIVKGREPQGTATEISIDNHKAIKLSGYSWKGNDFIYVKIPKNDSFLIISKTGITDKLYNFIIDSMDILDE